MGYASMLLPQLSMNVAVRWRAISVSLTAKLLPGNKISPYHVILWSGIKFRRALVCYIVLLDGDSAFNFAELCRYEKHFELATVKDRLFQASHTDEGDDKGVVLAVDEWMTTVCTTTMSVESARKLAMEVDTWSFPTAKKTIKLTSRVPWHSELETNPFQRARVGAVLKSELSRGYLFHCKTHVRRLSMIHSCVRPSPRRCS